MRGEGRKGYSAKRSSDPPGSLPRSQSSGTGLSVSCGYQQRYAMGEPDKVLGRDRVGIVKESCGYRARWISIRGKFVLSTNPGYKTRWGVAR